MIKDPKECGICGKKYTRGTGKYYTPEFMDLNQKISDKESDTESDRESDKESVKESDKESDKESFEESEEDEPEYVPKKGKRGAPTVRNSVPAKKRKYTKKSKVVKKPQ